MSILKEKHERDVELGMCSHCKSLKISGRFSFGFWVPQCKSFNSWWTAWIVGKKHNYYLRFTLPFLKRPK